MSERLKSTGSISNEKIIEDLTKNLEFSVNTGNTEGDLDASSSSKENADSASNETERSSAVPPPRQEGRHDEKPYDWERDGASDDEPDAEDEPADEESPKDAEVDLTDDEKAERQILAEGLKGAGNEAFQVGDFERSIEKYTEALRICPLQFSQQRSVLYCNRAAAKMKLNRYKSASNDCTKAIELDNTYLKAYYRRAQSYELTKKYDESLEDYKKILELDPSHKEAHCALVRLPPIINERNEKLKTEMIGKLKDLGNMILKPFGLSTDNFKLEQDPNSEGYKINFSK